MRLNHAVRCPGCRLQVNPYVIERFTGSLKNRSKVECPTCGVGFKAEVFMFREHGTDRVYPAALVVD